MFAEKKKRWFLLGVACLIVGIWFFFRERQMQATSLSAPTPPKPATGKPRKLAVADARKFGESHLREWRRQGLKSSWDRKDGVLVRVYPYVPDDQPMVELHFFTRAENGKLKPAKVGSIYVAHAGPDGLPSREAPEGEYRGGVSEVGYGLCTFAGGPDINGRMFTFGHRYYIAFGLLGDDNNLAHQKFFENVITIPEHIPRGKIYYIDLVATIPAGTFQKQKTLKKCLRGKICHFKMEPSKLHVTYMTPGEGQLSRSLINKAGEFTIGNFPLGGRLLVEDRRSREGDQGHVYFLVRSVSKLEIRLPEDADLVIRPSEVIPFKVFIPETIDISKVMAVGLKLNRDDPFPVAWNQLRKKTTNREIELKFVPGHYFVDIVTGNDKKDLKFMVLGPIEVKAGDRDKVIRLPE